MFEDTCVKSKSSLNVIFILKIENLLKWLKRIMFHQYLRRYDHFGRGLFDVVPCSFIEISEIVGSGCKLTRNFSLNRPE
jgi:hypothetical protein